MASKFSCSLRYSDALKIKNTFLVYSDASDEYRIKYKSNVCRDLILSIEWRVPKQVLVTVKLYSKKFRKCFSSKGNIVNGCNTFMKLRGGFNVCSSPNYTILCLINIMPFVQFKEYTEICAESGNTLEKCNSLPPVSKLPLDLNYKILDNLVKPIEEKYLEISQPNTSEKPYGISEMLRNELITNGTHSEDIDDKVTVGSKAHVYKVETNEEVFENTSSCIKFESESVQYKSCLLGDMSSTEIKNDIDKAVKINTVVKSYSPQVVEGQELFERCNLAPRTEDFNMDLHVQKALQQTDTQNNLFLPNPADIPSSNQDTSFHVNTVCSDFEIDYPYSLISNNISLNTGTVMDINSVGTLTDKNNLAVDNTRDIKDIESGSASKQKDIFVEAEAQDVSTNECNSLLDDVDSERKDSMETNVHETVYEKIDLTMENESLQLSEDKEIHMLSDVNETIKSEIGIDCQMEMSSDKVYETKEAMEISSSGDSNIALSDFNNTVKNSKVTNTDELLRAEDILMNSDSGIEMHIEDKYMSVHKEDSIKANIGIPKGTLLHSSSETNLDTEMESLKNEHEAFSSDAEHASIVRDDPISIILNSSTKDLLRNENLEISSTDMGSSAKSKRIEDSKINNAHSDDIQLIESDSMIINKIKVSEFQPQCSSASDRNHITAGFTDNSAANTKVNKGPHAVSNIFTSKGNFVSETLMQMCSTQISQSTSAKSSGTAKRTAVTKLSESDLSTDACTQVLPVMETKLKGLSMNMLDLLMSGSMSDAVISNGKREVKVHKAILSARSSVFKKIFTELAEGSLENRVRVNVPSYIMEDLVVFMYAGLVNIKSKKMAHDLCRSAKRYCIKDLIDICSKYISK